MRPLACAFLLLLQLTACAIDDNVPTGSSALAFRGSQRSGDRKAAPSQAGLLAQTLTACTPETIAPAPTLEGQLPGTWLDYGGGNVVLAFDGDAIGLYEQDDSLPPRYELKARGRYQAPADTLTVDWADGSTEQNGAVVENVTDCVMLSFTERSARLGSDAYFERVHCEVATAALPSDPTASAAANGAPASSAVDAGMSEGSR